MLSEYTLTFSLKWNNNFNFYGNAYLIPYFYFYLIYYPREKNFRTQLWHIFCISDFVNVKDFVMIISFVNFYSTIRNLENEINI